MVFSAVLLGLLFFNMKWLAVLLLAANLVIVVYGKKIFAVCCSTKSRSYNEAVDGIKKRLFVDLNNLGKKGEKLKILEVGAGSGANFKYINRAAKVTAVEPNMHFADYFNESRSKFPKLDIGDMVEGHCEDLEAAGIKDESVDAVIITLVLCSVSDPTRCLQEAKRVLKAGGKLFYLEPVAAEEPGMVRNVQKLATTSGLLPFLLDGCSPARTTERTMQMAGFSNVEQTKFEPPTHPDGDILINVLGLALGPLVMGVATK